VATISTLISKERRPAPPPSVPPPADPSTLWQPVGPPRKFAVVGMRMIWWAWEPNEDGGINYVSFAVYDLAFTNMGSLTRAHPIDMTTDDFDVRFGREVFAECPPAIIGSVKWDGCMEWSHQDGGEHVCSDADFDDALMVLRLARTAAAEELTQWEG